MSEDDSQSTGRDDGDSSGETFEGSDDPAQISDDQLPEDLRPTDDNPLAKPQDDDDEGGGMNLQEQADGAGGGGAPPA